MYESGVPPAPIQDIDALRAFNDSFAITFVTRGNSDQAQINRMMFAIFDERCPGIRFSLGDVPHYRSAAIAALNVLGVLSEIANEPPDEMRQQQATTSAISAADITISELDLIREREVEWINEERMLRERPLSS